MPVLDLTVQGVQQVDQSPEIPFLRNVWSIIQAPEERRRHCSRVVSNSVSLHNYETHSKAWIFNPQPGEDQMMAELQKEHAVKLVTLLLFGYHAVISTHSTASAKDVEFISTKLWKNVFTYWIHIHRPELVPYIPLVDPIPKSGMEFQAAIEAQYKKAVTQIRTDKYGMPLASKQQQQQPTQDAASGGASKDLQSVVEKGSTTSRFMEPITNITTSVKAAFVAVQLYVTMITNFFRSAWTMGHWWWMVFGYYKNHYLFTEKVRTQSAKADVGFLVVSMMVSMMIGLIVGMFIGPFVAGRFY